MVLLHLVNINVGQEGPVLAGRHVVDELNDIQREVGLRNRVGVSAPMIQKPSGIYRSQSLLSYVLGTRESTPDGSHERELTVRAHARLLSRPLADHPNSQR